MGGDRIQYLVPIICYYLGCLVGTANLSQLAAADITPLHSGYLPVGDPGSGSKLYYAYYEAQTPPSQNEAEPPVVLWLQGGPGCASTFGAFYELGPYSVDANLTLTSNPGAWTQHFGLLLIDQPIGSGFSVVGVNQSIPSDEIAMAAQLYQGLQGFFKQHSSLQKRPFFITGESYAGKYVPSIAHYILQQHEQSLKQSLLPRMHTASYSFNRLQLLHHRPLPPNPEPPLFQLHGIAIGNGLTDPLTQTLTIASTAYHMGLLSTASKEVLEAQQELVVKQIQKENWERARHERNELLRMVANLTGISTAMDIRRTTDYDAAGSIDRFLNQTWVKRALGADEDVVYASCSDAVGSAMGADVMRSVKHLIPDILQHMPVMLYQGQFDLQDGPASNQPWMDGLAWPYHETFKSASSHLWEVDGKVAGWWRQAGPLKHVVLRNAGHMVPHDQPVAALAMLKDWIGDVLALMVPTHHTKDEGGPTTSRSAAFRRPAS